MPQEYSMNVENSKRNLVEGFQDLVSTHFQPLIQQAGPCMAGRSSSEVVVHFLMAAIPTLLTLVLLLMLYPFISQLYFAWTAYKKRRGEENTAPLKAEWKLKRMKIEHDGALVEQQQAECEYQAALEEMVATRRAHTAAVSKDAGAAEVLDQLKHGSLGERQRAVEAAEAVAVARVRAAKDKVDQTQRALQQAMQTHLTITKPNTMWWQVCGDVVRGARGGRWLASGVEQLLNTSAHFTLLFTVAWLVGVLYAGVHLHTATTLQHPLHWLEDNSSEDVVGCEEINTITRDRLLDASSSPMWQVWAASWRGRGVAVHVLKPDLPDSAYHNVRRVGAVLRAMRVQQSTQHVPRLLGQCGTTLVTELLPYSLTQVLDRVPGLPSQDRNKFDSCPSVCGKLKYADEPKLWCGGRAVMPRDDIVRAAAALDAARAIQAIHETSVPAGGTLAHLQVSVGSFWMSSNGVLKLWRLEDVQLMRSSAGFCVDNDQVHSLAAANAPEVPPSAFHSLSHHTLTAKVDIYNLAEVMVTLLGSPPAWKASTISPGGHLDYPSPEGALCSRGEHGTCVLWWKLLKFCWQPKPNRRPTAEQVVKLLEFILAIAQAERRNSGPGTSVFMLDEDGQYSSFVRGFIGTDPTSPCFDNKCKPLCEAPPSPNSPFAPYPPLFPPPPPPPPLSILPPFRPPPMSRKQKVMVRSGKGRRRLPDTKRGGEARSGMQVDVERRRGRKVVSPKGKVANSNKVIQATRKNGEITKVELVDKPVLPEKKIKQFASAPPSEVMFLLNEGMKVKGDKVAPALVESINGLLIKKLGSGTKVNSSTVAQALLESMDDTLKGLGHQDFSTKADFVEEYQVKDGSKDPEFIKLQHDSISQTISPPPPSPSPPPPRPPPWQPPPIPPRPPVPNTYTPQSPPYPPHPPPNPPHPPHPDQGKLPAYFSGTDIYHSLGMIRTALDGLDDKRH